MVTGNKQFAGRRLFGRLSRGLRHRATVYEMCARNRFSRQKLVDNGKAPIISLTTFGPRLASVHIVIETLLKQKPAPAAIYLWLHENDVSAAGLPKTLLRLRQRGLFIEFIPEDLKGAKKLVYAAKRFPHRTIVTVDDDCLYPRRWLSILLRESRKFPTHVIAYRAWYLQLGRSKRFKAYNQMMDDTLGSCDASFNILPTGNAGVLYPPASLNEEIGNTELMMRLCPGADDIWFKAMTMLNGVRSRRVYKSNWMPPPLRIDGPTLWDSNVEKNDSHLKRTFDYFQLYRYLK